MKYTVLALLTCYLTSSLSFLSTKCGLKSARTRHGGDMLNVFNPQFLIETDDTSRFPERVSSNTTFTNTEKLSLPAKLESIQMPALNLRELVRFSYDHFKN